jgi:hypothetical protein
MQQKSKGLESFLGGEGFLKEICLLEDLGINGRIILK